MEVVNPLLAKALDLLKHGNTEQAEQEFARAATASCSAFGENDIVTARTLAHLARLCASRGKLDVAVPIYERIICIHEALPVPSNTDHALALMDLASLREGGNADVRAGAADDADALRRKADEIMREVGARLQKEAEKAQRGEEGASGDYVEGEGSEYNASSGEGDTGEDDDSEESEEEASVNEDGDRAGGE